MAIVEWPLLTAPEPVPTFDVTGWGRPSQCGGHRCAPCRIRSTWTSSFTSYTATKGRGANTNSRVPLTRPGRPRSGKVCEGKRCRRRSGELSDVPNRDWSRRGSRRCARGRPRRPSSSGRASAAIAPVHASHDVVVLEQSAFTCGGATLLDLAAEPLVMVDRAGQQVERDLVD